MESTVLNIGIPYPFSEGAVPEDNQRSGGVNAEAGEVKVGGDVVGRDKASNITTIDASSKESTGMNVMGVIVVVGLILIVILALALVFGLRAQDSRQALNPQLAETASAALVVSTPPLTVTPTIERNVFSIEEIPFKVFAYGGVNETNGQGSGTLILVRNGITGTEYYLDYFLPDEGDGYAGLAFRFLDPQDWTPYEFVEITVSFEDPEASCDFGIRDIADKIGYVRLGGSNPTSDIDLAISGKQQTAKIPLATSFETVNRKVVHELIFNADSYFVRGHHILKIISIKLLKA
jgi:hypothetical protein